MINKLAISTAALSLRIALGEDPTSPIDIFSLAHTIPRLTLVFYPMGDHLSGMCIKNDCNSVIALNSSMSDGRQRFSLAHELYHLNFDEDGQSIICAKNIGSGNEVEKTADQFASYFLMPPVALADAIKKMQSRNSGILGIKEIVKLEQYFRVSRRALLYRLIEDEILTQQEADQFRHGVIRSAINLGYDDSLYRPLPENQQYKTYGFYIQQAEELLEKDLISNGKYEQLLLTAFRPDLVYGDGFEEGELND